MDRHLLPHHFDVIPGLHFNPEHFSPPAGAMKEITITRRVLRELVPSADLMRSFFCDTPRVSRPRTGFGNGLQTVHFLDRETNSVEVVVLLPGVRLLT